MRSFSRIFPNLERGGNFDFPRDIDSLSIDHHRTNERFTDLLYLQYRYAATAEMLAEMFFDEGIKMDEDTCNALYMGIGTDSGFFKIQLHLAAYAPDGEPTRRDGS